MLRHRARGPAALLRNAVLNRAGIRRFLHEATLEKYASQPVTRKTLNTLTFPDISEESLYASANYIRDELPIRLSHRIVEMKRLPYFVLTTPSLNHVYNLYKDAFTSCAMFPPITTMEEEARFHHLIKRVVSDSSGVIDLVATGLIEARRAAQRLGILDGNRLHEQLQDWVELSMASRIGRRVLAEQHIALHEAVINTDNKYLASERPEHLFNGVVDMRCDVMLCLRQAIHAAKGVSEQRYGIAPEVDISGCDVAVLPFVRAHLHYVLFELLKNAMRATVEHAGGRIGRWLPIEKGMPHVHVFVAEGPSQLTIRISDGGGGLRRGEKDKIFEYGYTTVGEEEDQESLTEAIGGNLLGDALSSRGNRESPMAGLGFGLPMSRLYARYFGGDTAVVNLEGYGCDVYVTLSRTGDVFENIRI